MNQAYLNVREGLLSLLCVGDRISRIYTVKTGAYEEHLFTIALCTILEVHPDHLVVTKSYSGFISGVVEFNAIDMYGGRLYIWNTGSHFYKLPPEDRVLKLIEVVESNTTRFEDYGRGI